MRLSRYFILVVLFVVLPFFSFAGNLLKGRITDDHGLALEGVIVEVTDLKTGAATDSNGNYVISNLPKGKYIVEVHLLSYGTITSTINIDGETVHNFQLSESVIEKNTVVVTGASLASEERRNITPIQSISLKQLHEKASTNIIDAITELPGVSAITTGPAISKPVIRGLGYNRIITLNDGVRQEGQQWGDEHGIEIDDYNVTRIEVLKGPASLAYGSDALAGVINIISSPNIPAGKIIGNISSNYQSNSGLGAIHADLGINKNGITWYAYGTRKVSHDYHNAYDGYVFNSRFENTDYGASLGINKSWGSSHFSYTSFHMKTGMSEGLRDSATGHLVKEEYIDGLVQDKITTIADDHSYELHTPYQKIDHEKLVWDNNIYLGNGGRIGLTGCYQVNHRREYGDPSNYNAAGLSLLLETATYDLKYFMPVLNGWQMSTGLNGMGQWNTNQGADFLVPDYYLADLGIYAMGKKDWDDWNVAGGLRYDSRVLNSYERKEINANAQVPTLFAIVAVPFTAFYTNMSGSLGAGHNLNKETILKLNFSAGFRAPNIAELSANGVHEGTIRYEIGNMNLVPENSFEADLGISWNIEHLMVNVSVFDNFIKNFIYVRKLNSVSGTDSIPTFNNDPGYSSFIYTQGDANLYGGEIYADFHPHPFDWLHLENTFSYVRGHLVEPVEGTTNLPYMPPARWLVELRAQKKSLGKYFRNAYAKAGIDMNFAQNNVFDAYGTERTAQGYTLFNAGIGADFTDRKHRSIFTLTVAANNITDVAYQNSLSRLRYTDMNNVTGRMGLFNMGRNVSIMLSVPLDIK